MNIIDIVLQQSQKSAFHSFKLSAQENLRIERKIRLLITIIIGSYCLESIAKGPLTLLKYCIFLFELCLHKDICRKNH